MNKEIFLLLVIKMVSLLSRIRKVSRDYNYDISSGSIYSGSVSSGVGDIESDDDVDSKQIVLSQINDGNYKYLSIEYPGVSKEKLKDYLERNRFFRTAVASNRMEQLRTDRNAYPLFDTTDYANQNYAAYVFYEINNLIKIYEDGRIKLIKPEEGEEEIPGQIIREKSKTPTFIVSPTRSPIAITKGRSRGGRR